MFIEYKEGSKNAGTNAEKSEFVETFQDCGYLLKENEIVIDIDGLAKETIEKMISFFEIKTQIVHTSRGVHLYYTLPKGYKNKPEFVCPIGFKIESFTSKQRPNGLTIKQNGVMRKIDNIGKREVLPDMFKRVKGLEDLNGLSEGDSRNNRLYQHKFRIAQLDNYKKMLRFINEYIFAEPLELNEFDIVIRDEDIRAEDNQEPQVAEQLKRKLKVVKYNDQMYSYDGERYVSNEFIQEIYEQLPDKKTHYVEEVIRQLDKRSRNVQQPTHGWDVKFRNGIIRNGRFIDIDSVEFTPYFIDIDYNEDAEPVQAVDDYLQHLSQGDKGYIKLILQMMAHGLITDPEVKRQIAKFFVLIGNGSNGKGTMLTIIRMLFGGDYCSSNSIEQLADERYFVSMQGKLFNLGDDVQDKMIDHEQMKNLKNIATCDYVATRQLFKQSKDAVLTCSMIFTSNHALKSFEKGEAYQRRVVWLPMFAKPTKKDPRFISKLTTPEAKEYWVKLIVDAYMELYQNGEIDIPDIVQEHNKEYHADNNNVLEFMEGYENEYFIGKRPPQIYEEYEIWTNDNGLTVHSKKMLKDTLEKARGLVVGSKKINGQVAKVYMAK
jgi:putative DNA primase/helicase